MCSVYHKEIIPVWGEELRETMQTPKACRNPMPNVVLWHYHHLLPSCVMHVWVFIASDTSSCPWEQHHYAFTVVGEWTWIHYQTDRQTDVHPFELSTYINEFHVLVEVGKQGEPLSFPALFLLNPFPPIRKTESSRYSKRPISILMGLRPWHLHVCGVNGKERVKVEINSPSW